MYVYWTLYIITVSYENSVSMFCSPKRIKKNHIFSFIASYYKGQYFISGYAGYIFWWLHIQNRSYAIKNSRGSTEAREKCPIKMKRLIKLKPNSLTLWCCKFSQRCKYKMRRVILNSIENKFL